MNRLSVIVKIIVLSGVVFILTLFVWGFFESRLGLPHVVFFQIPSLLFWPLLLSIFYTVVSIHSWVDRPLRDLREAIRKAAAGDFLIRLSADSEKQIGEVQREFNRMVSNVAHLTARKLSTEKDLQAIEKEVQMKKKLQGLVQDLSLLYEIGQEINQAIDTKTLYEVVANVVRQQLSMDNFSLMEWNPAAGLLTVKAAFGFPDNKDVLETSFRAEEGIAGEVVRRGRMIYVKNTATDRMFVHKKVPIRGSLIVVPLKYKGETIGIANFGRNKIDAFSLNDMKMLTLVASQVALAIANADLYTKTRELSVTDELTGVYNRRYFGNVLQLEWKRAQRFNRDLSLLMCDVDYFKKYNDTFGHLEGDKILKEIALLLSKNLREVDTVSRFGGEEFILLLPDTDKRGAMAVAEKLRHLVQENLRDITVSIGVANFPDDVKDLDDLIDHADIALYEAKDKGRNRVVAYQQAKKSEMLKEPEPSKEPPTKTRVVH